MNSYNGSEDDKEDKLWSENETPNNQPMPKGQISPKGPLKGPGKSGWMDGCCHVAVEEVCRWEGVDEDCQHPGQEIEGSQLGGKTESMSRVVTC